MATNPKTYTARARPSGHGGLAPRPCECTGNEVCGTCQPELVARYESDDYPPRIAWYKEHATVDEALEHIAPKRK